MDDRTDLENRRNRKATRGSNPLVSARRVSAQGRPTLGGRIPPPPLYLAIVIPQTFSTPVCLRVLAASLRVEPVVKTSSNNKILGYKDIEILGETAKTP